MEEVRQEWAASGVGGTESFSLSDEFGNNYYEALPGYGPYERKRWVEGAHYYFDPSEVRAENEKMIDFVFSLIRSFLR